MSNYLARLKAITSEKRLPSKLTELTQAPSVSSVSESGRHVLDIEDEKAAPAISLEQRRANVENLLDRMAVENERRRDWHTQPVDGWREGVLEWTNAKTGEANVIELPRRPRR